MTQNQWTKHFDTWSASYDRAVQGDGYPFAGYGEILDRMVEHANVRAGNRVLDLGIGTGNLSLRLSCSDIELWGLDLSQRMIDIAARRLPEAHFLCADMTEAWPEELPDRFDVIVSAYTLHHLADAQKPEMIQRLADLLSPDGRIIIGDLAFPTRIALEETREAWHDKWDGDEFPWVAEDVIARIDSAVRVSFEPISFCGGVFVVSPPTG